jgi:hypothetical protein
MVEVVLPSAGTEVGEAATVDTDADTAPAVNVTVAVWVTTTESVVSVAVKTSAAAVVDLTVKVACPLALVVPFTVVMVGEPAPEVLASVTVFPDTGLLFTSFRVTVIVEVVEPLATTEVGLALTVDWAAVGVPVKVTVAV